MRLTLEARLGPGARRGRHPSPAAPLALSI